MNPQRLDSLLESKVRNEHRHSLARTIIIVVLCLAVLVGTAVAVVYVVASSKDTPEDQPYTDQDTVEPPSGEPEDSQNVTQPDETQKPDENTPVDPNTENQPDAEPTPVDPDTENQPDPEPTPNEPVETYKHQLQMVWFDGAEKSLPDELTLSVLYGSKLITTINLTEESGWQTSWVDTYHAEDLTLLGDFPTDISASFSISGEHITVTGRYKNAPAESGDATLPQTGRDLWPLYLAVGGGLISIALGIFLSLKKRST